MLFHEYRCSTCDKLLFKGLLVDSEVEVKCRGCGTIVTFHGAQKEQLLCYKEHCANRVSRGMAVGEAKGRSA